MGVAETACVVLVNGGMGLGSRDVDGWSMVGVLRCICTGLSVRVDEFGVNGRDVAFACFTAATALLICMCLREVAREVGATVEVAELVPAALALGG